MQQLQGPQRRVLGGLWPESSGRKAKSRSRFDFNFDSLSLAPTSAPAASLALEVATFPILGGPPV